MRASLVVLLSLIALSGAAAPAKAADAGAADAGINLATATCATARQENAPVNPRNLAPAYAGRIAAKASHARLSPDLVKAIGDTLRRACEGADAAQRKLADIAAGVAIPQAGDKDRDFASLTCLQLALVWREEARMIVPFLVALRDAAANAPLSRAGLDKVGEGLPKACREAGNENKLATELAQGLR